MVLNETMNATVNMTADFLANATNLTADITFSEQVKQVYYPVIKERTIELVTAPKAHPDMMWIVFPLVVSVLFMTLYFGRYKQEELGWNTAFGNSLALLFVAVDLFREVAKDTSNLNLLETGVITSKLLVPVILFALAILLLLSNFFHILPKFFAFFISSALPINLFAYVSIVVVYTGFPFDRFTLASAFVLFMMLMVVLAIIRVFEPEDWREKQQAMIDKMADRSDRRKSRKRYEKEEGED